MTKFMPISGGQFSSKVYDLNGSDMTVGVAGGAGTVQSVSVTTANGVSGSVATADTTPAITLTLGAITPTSVNSVVLSGGSTPTLSVTGTSSISGSNTGDNATNTQYSGLAASKQDVNSNLTTIAGLTATTDNFIVSVSSAWASRTPAQVKSTLSLNNVDNTSDSTKNSATATLTNKRITKRTGTTTSSATPTINTDNVDYYYITAQTEDITSFTTNLSGTPTVGQTLWIAITGTAARAITWGSSFESSTVQLPSTTVTTNRLDIGFVWNSISSKWRCVAAS